MTTKYAELLNTANIRTTLRRMFRNSLGEALGELFQNSQRAGATRVTLTSTRDKIDGRYQYGFRYQDNGRGLDGMDGFHTLLKLAESAYDPAVVANQHPMGVGFHALLALSNVTQVFIRSGALELHIDTARWWSDEVYSAGWFARVTPLETPVEGFELHVITDEDWVGYDLGNRLPTEVVGLNGLYDTADLVNHPALGYEGLLEITFDGTPVLTSPTVSKKLLPEVLFETTYEGQVLRIGLAHENHDHGLGSCSIINWYGQLINAGSSAVYPFKFYLEVREGRPVNPKSPSREGVIEDEAWQALVKFARDAIFAWVADPANETQLQPSTVGGLYELDGTRARESCPYAVVRPILPPQPAASEELGRQGLGDLAIVKYAEFNGQILERRMLVLQRATEPREGIHWEILHERAEGLADVMYATHQAGFILVHGNRQRFLQKPARLVWLVNPDQAQVKHGVTLLAHPGKYALDTSDENLPSADTAFHPLPTTYSLQAHREMQSIDRVGGMDLYLYTPSVGTFFESQGTRLCRRNDTAGRLRFEESIKALMCDLLGGAVPANFTFEQLAARWPDRVVAIDQARVYRDKAGKPERVKVWTTCGDMRTFPIYG